MVEACLRSHERHPRWRYASQFSFRHLGYKLDLNIRECLVRKDGQPVYSLHARRQRQIKDKLDAISAERERIHSLVGYLACYCGKKELCSCSQRQNSATSQSRVVTKGEIPWSIYHSGLLQPITPAQAVAPWPLSRAAGSASGNP